MKTGFLKTKRFRFILGISLVTGLLTLSISCMNNKKAEIITEMQTYLNNTIEPELKLQREKLDQVLTDSEKQRVAVLRADAKEIADSFIKFHVKIAKLDEKATYQLSDSEVKYYNDVQKKTRKIVTECWAILDNHEAEFGLLHKEIYPKMITWHKDMMKIITSNIHCNFHGHGKKVHKHQLKGVKIQLVNANFTVK